MGIFLVYLTKFSAYEALRAASFDRYAGTPLTMLAMLAALAGIDLYAQAPLSKRFYAGALALLLLVTPHIYAARFLLRGNVRESMELRAPYTAAERTLAACEADTRICIVAQESDGFEQMVFSYLLWPKHAVTGGSYGEPFYSGDIWTRSMDATAWTEHLAGYCEYVLLFRLNDYFRTEFQGAFAQGVPIEEGALYRVDPASGRLTPAAG